MRRTTIITEKVKCLIEGMNIYKKFNNMISTTSKFKIIDFNDVYFQPEKYGFSLRNFKINVQEKTLEVRNIKAKVIGI